MFLFKATEYAMRRLLIASLSVSTALLTAQAPLAQTADAAKAPDAKALSVTARGNEPFWTVKLGDGRMVFTPMDGAAVDVALPAAEAVEGDGARYAAADLTVTLTPMLCRDSMAGMPHPLTATVETGGKSLQGCAGAPVDLLAGGEWVVTKIGDAAVAEPVKVTIAFDAAKGGVAGSAGCNRYFGSFTLTGEGLSFGPGMGSTMMACEDNAMAAERAFLSAMTTVDRFDIDADGALLLISADAPVMRAQR